VALLRWPALLAQVGVPARNEELPPPSPHRCRARNSGARPPVHPSQSAHLLTWPQKGGVAYAPTSVPFLQRLAMARRPRSPVGGNGAVQKTCCRALWTRPMPATSVAQASASITTFRCTRRLAPSSEKLFMTRSPRLFRVISRREPAEGSAELAAVPCSSGEQRKNQWVISMKSHSRPTSAAASARGARRQIRLTNGDTSAFVPPACPHVLHGDKKEGPPPRAALP
jgi:hypothetical protein